MVESGRKLRNGCYNYRHNLLIAFMFALFVGVISSCATKTKIEYRDRDVNHYSTNYVHDTFIDRITDSVFLEVFTKGDTVYQNKYKIQYKWRDRAVVKADTCWRDSVVTEYKEKVVEVTKIPKIYHATMLFSIFCIIFASIKLARWLKIR